MPPKKSARKPAVKAARKEVWKKVPFCPSHSISSWGRVRRNSSVEKRGRKTIKIPSEIVRLRPDAFGRPYYYFPGNEFVRNETNISELVLEMFFGVIAEEVYVMAWNKNGDFGDNRIENLEWISVNEYYDNLDVIADVARFRHRGKSVEVVDIDTGERFKSIYAAAKARGLHSNVLARAIWGVSDNYTSLRRAAVVDEFYAKYEALGKRKKVGSGSGRGGRIR